MAPVIDFPVDVIVCHLSNIELCYLNRAVVRYDSNGSQKGVPRDSEPRIQWSVERRDWEPRVNRLRGPKEEQHEADGESSSGSSREQVIEMQLRPK